MTEAKNVNGVNVSQLLETINAIKGKPEAAKSRFRATNKWVEGGENCTTIKDFYGACEPRTHAKPFSLTADEPPLLLGKDKGANPVEYLLTALAGCLTTSLVYHAAARGIKLDEVESTLEGDLDLHGFLGLDEKVRSGYQNIQVTFKIKADAPKEQLEELCQLAQKRSPVMDVVSKGAPVSVKLGS